MNEIPFHKPDLTSREWDYLKASFESGKLSGDGPFTHKAQAHLENELGVPKVLLTPSCTDALEMSALLSEVGPGDEVLLPAFTFVSTATAFALRGAALRFLDIERDTLNLSPASLAEHITPKTKVVVPVHYAGVPCRMGEILDLCKSQNIIVVEDNAHGLYGKWEGRYLGTLGHLATQSFHETKNFTCGEGGALLINDASFIDRAQIIREKGTNRTQFLEGRVEKYTWHDIGSSYLLSDLAASMLLGQLERRQEIQSRRKQIWDRYQSGLAPWAAKADVHLPSVPTNCEPAYHLYYMVMPTPESRSSLMKHLAANGVKTTFHFLPLNASPMGQKLGARPGDAPVSEWVASRLIRIPLYSRMTDEETQRVIESICSFSI